jgi:hypothetical protein
MPIEEITVFEMVAYSHLFSVSVDLSDPRLIPSLEMISWHWKTARDLALKELGFNVKPDCDRFAIKNLKGRALFLVSIYKLCERCHGMQSATGLKVPYKNAGEWFSKIAIELVGIELDKCIQPKKVYNSNYKKALLDVERNMVKQLRSLQNPYKESFVEDGSIRYQAQALKIMIDVSIKLVDVNKKFKREYWNVFLSAYSAYIKELSNPVYGVGYAKGNKWTLQFGRGRK